jgi:antitoxin ParD1/3/4
VTADRRSDYVRDLIRRDQERVQALAELQRLITEGIESGVSDRSMDEVLELAREKASRAAGSW